MLLVLIRAGTFIRYAPATIERYLQVRVGMTGELAAEYMVADLG